METTKNTDKHNFSFGPTLCKAREEQGISLEKVASEIFIKERYLEALEKEDFDLMPQEVFARGFAINYAKYLKIDHTQIAESFNNKYPDDKKIKRSEDIESPLKPMGTLQRDNTGRKLRFNPFLLLGVIAITILAIFLLRTINNAEFGQDETETPIENSINIDDQLAGAGIVDVNSSGSALDINSNAEMTEAADGNTSTELQSSGSLVSELTGADLIELWVRKNTNIVIVDANNNTVMTGEQSRGGYKVEGKAPFKVSIEKANNVVINFNNKPIKFAKNTEDNKTTFELK